MWYFVIFQPSKCKKKSFSASNLINLTYFPKWLRKSAKILLYKLKKLRNSEPGGGSGLNCTSEHNSLSWLVSDWVTRADNDQARLPWKWDCVILFKFSFPNHDNLAKGRSDAVTTIQLPFKVCSIECDQEANLRQSSLQFVLRVFTAQNEFDITGYLSRSKYLAPSAEVRALKFYSYCFTSL